jgi:hypothetical protein
MKNLDFKSLIESVIGKYNLTLVAYVSTILISMFSSVSVVSAQTVLFDFDNAPLYTSLPIDQTANGITAHLAATGQGYSIQAANVLGFTPQGFAGHILYPNSINLSDLLIKFDQTITDFSIVYADQELACDDAATMRITAYMNGNYVGTNTRTTAHPGTWPVDTLSCSFPLGFDSVIVHYDSHPPTCLDYGVVYVADNMRVTSLSTSGISNQKISIERLIIPNPVSQSTTISFSLNQSENINISIYDITGRLVKNILNGDLKAGEHKIFWDVNYTIQSGIYFLRLTGEDFSQICKLVVVK